jgi:hypothetical protein
VGYNAPPSGPVSWLIIGKGQSIAIPIDLTLPGATTAVLKRYLLRFAPDTVLIRL